MSVGIGLAEIKHVMSLLSIPLSDEPTKLINDLAEIEAWYSRIVYLLAEANGALDEFSAESLPPKEGRSELDRKVALEGRCAPVRMNRDKLQGLGDAIEQRIRLGMTILSYQKELNIRAHASHTSKEAA